MKILKFYHRFSKMPKTTRGTFIEAIGVDKLEDMDPEFIKKDTAIKGGGHYPLPEKGKVIILYLWTVATDFKSSYHWTTIRTWTEDKEKYYRKMVGEEVRVIINSIT